MAIEKINEKTGLKLNQHHLKAIQFVFSIRETKYDKASFNPAKTNAKYCHYDEPFRRHLFTEDFVSFISDLLNSEKTTPEEINQHFKSKKKLKI